MKLAAVFLLISLISLAMVSPIRPVFSSNTNQNPKGAAYNYLIQCYNPILQLCYESPNLNPNVYWVISDNLLASYALENWNRTIADNIRNKIVELSKEYNLLRCEQTGLPRDLKHEVLLGYSVDLPFKSKIDLTLNSSYYGSTLKAEQPTSSPASNFENYGDLACYASLVRWREQNYSGSDYYYEKFKTMWDGNGFADQAFNGSYSTYKLALFYYLNRALGKGHFSFESSLVERIWKCQDLNGGFKTNYYANGTFPICDTNTETTSIVLLSDPPLPPPRVKAGAYYYLWWGIPFNDHWNESVKGTPLLWKYNSSDPEVADRHILLAKQHGIDFFTISWMGKGLWIDWINDTADHSWDFDEIDQNLNSFLRAPHLADFDFCLLYETKNVLDTANQGHKNFTEIFLSDIEYAAQRYFINSSYLKAVDGNNSYPVLFIYDVPYLYENLTVPAAQGLLDALRQSLGFNVYLVGDIGAGPFPPDTNSSLLHSLNASTSYFYDDPSKGWDSILADCSQYYPEWRLTMNSKGMAFVPNAYPGFNNTGLKDVNKPVPLEPNVMRFTEMMSIASSQADDPLRMVMITSWNEWLEGTAIEPSLENGESFLHAIPEFPQTLGLITTMTTTLLAVIFHKKKIFQKKGESYGTFLPRS